MCLSEKGKSATRTRRAHCTLDRNDLVQDTPGHVFNIESCRPVAGIRGVAADADLHPTIAHMFDFCSDFTRPWQNNRLFGPRRKERWNSSRRLLEGRNGRREEGVKQRYEEGFSLKKMDV